MNLFFVIITRNTKFYIILPVVSLLYVSSDFGITKQKCSYRDCELIFQRMFNNVSKLITRS